MQTSELHCNRKASLIREHVTCMICFTVQCSSALCAVLCAADQNRRTYPKFSSKKARAPHEGNEAARHLTVARCDETCLPGSLFRPYQTRRSYCAALSSLQIRVEDAPIIGRCLQRGSSLGHSCIPARARPRSTRTSGVLQSAMIRSRTATTICLRQLEGCGREGNADLRRRSNRLSCTCDGMRVHNKTSCLNWGEPDRAGTSQTRALLQIPPNSSVLNSVRTNLQAGECAYCARGTWPECCTR